MSSNTLNDLTIGFIKTELELALTFVSVAHTKYSMGNRVGGDTARDRAEKAFQEAVNRLKGVPNQNSSRVRAILKLKAKAAKAINVLNAARKAA